MILRCQLCDEPISPDLIDLAEFEGRVVCRSCAEGGADEAGNDPPGVAGQDDAPATIVNIHGEMLLAMDASAGGMARAREAVARWRLDVLRRLDQQLPLLRDAYLAMAKEERRVFREYVEAVAQLQDCEADGVFGNPFCLFRVDLLFRPLEPAHDGSPYAGHYVGREDQKMLLPKALAAAMTAWDVGEDFHISSVAEMEAYE